MGQNKNHVAQWLKSELEGSSYPLMLSEKVQNTLQREGFLLVLGDDENGVELKGAINRKIKAINKITPIILSDTKEINAVKSDADDLLWKFETDIPCSTFTIVDFNEPFCKGLIINIEDIK